MTDRNYDEPDPRALELIDLRTELAAVIKERDALRAELAAAVLQLRDVGRYS